MFILILPLAIGVSVLQLCNHDPRGRTLTFYYLINFLFFLLLLFFLYSFLPHFPFLFFLSGRSLLPSSPLARVKIVARFSDPPFTLEKILKPSDLYTSLYYFSFFSFFFIFRWSFRFFFSLFFSCFFFIFIFLNGSPLNVVPPPLSLLESLP